MSTVQSDMRLLWKIFRCTVQVSILFVLTIQSGIASDPHREYSRAIENARDLLNALVGHAKLPGLSVAVGVNGSIVWSAGFGYADIEQGVAVTPSSRFRIGSVSKTLTSFAVGLLIERGDMDLDAPIDRYVPMFPRKRWVFSVRQLGGHLAGIRNYRGNEFYSTIGYDSVTGALGIFSDDPLVAEPGSTYLYTTYGWTLVSAAIEGASGQSYLDFMSTEVFNTIGLLDTVAETTADIIPQRVRYYQRGDDGELQNAPFVDNSNKWAGGGYVSTTRDLVRFGLDFLDQKHLLPSTVELLTRSQATSSGEITNYGIGWETKRDLHGLITIGHGGGSVGGSTAFVVWPEDGIVVAVTTNLTDDPGVFELAYPLGEIFKADGEETTSVSGTYAIDVKSDTQTDWVAGILHIESGPAGYRGWISSAHGNFPTGHILWGRDEGEEMHLLLTSSGNIMNLRLEIHDDSVRGTAYGNANELLIQGFRIR